MRTDHVRGVREGNRTGSLRRQDGIVEADGMAQGTARRSTGVNADDQEPIDEDMPHLSPA